MKTQRVRLTIEVDTTLKRKEFKDVAYFTAQRLAQSIRSELVYCATEVVDHTCALADTRDARRI